ncbi:MAG: F0F1 ATP synthase subunit A [Verrucomicrobiae bacterium]|nr:F0F1 ATP synthase subunit A [Verrucomicrobiae bacterium]
MSRFYKIIFALALLIAASAASLQAQVPSVATAAAGSPAVAAEPAGPLVPMNAPTLFKIGPVPITNSIVLSWVVVLLIVVVVRIGTRRMSSDKTPSGLTNLLEAVVEGWDNLSQMILEPRVSRWVFPFAVTFFIFALISNFVDLIPGVGSIGYGLPAQPGAAFSSLPRAIGHVEMPFIRPPTSDANLTVAMALIFLVMTFVWALRYNGLVGLIKHVFGVKVDTNKWLYPLVALMFLFVGAMEALSIVFVRPLALAVRLYGNIFAGETLLTMTMTAKPFLLGLALSLPFYFFEIFVAVVQAFVFAMLTIVFAGTMCSHADEEHSKTKH